MKKIISLKNVKKTYRLYRKKNDRIKEIFLNKKLHTDFNALENINFDIFKGESFGIIGKNGSGKSTLLKLITGVLTPSEGSVAVNGNVSALLELGTGLNPEYNGIENIYLYGTTVGQTKEQIKEKIDDIVSFADIGEFIYQPLKTYSSGMFVRLAFSIVINVDPDILIVDEALSVGDNRFQLKSINKIKEFIKKRKTVIFVSHDTYTIKNLCDRVLWLNDGRIREIGNAEKVVMDYEIFMQKDSENIEEINLKSNSDIFELKEVTLLKNDEISNEFFTFDNIEVVIEYFLKKKLNDIVIGVAIYKSDDTYVCGVNTKIDDFKIEPNIGYNKLKLAYTNNFLLPGEYYIDVGFFESNGVGRIEYFRKYKKFYITSKHYIAEGVCVMEHSWFL